MSDSKIQTARIKEFAKILSFYKNKVNITRVKDKLGFSTNYELEDWLIDTEIPGILIDSENNIIEFSNESIQSINKIIQSTNEKKDSIIQISLNQKQKEAVERMEGPILVIAGAGSGKTMTLSYRVANMVLNHDINPSNILLLTFTRKSAEEMLNRASQIANIDLKEVSGGTFHSFGLLILRHYAQEFDLKNNFTIIDQPTSEDTLSLLANQLGFTSKEKTFPNKSSLLDIISKSRNKVSSIGSIVKEEYEEFIDEIPNLNSLYNAYQDYKKKQNYVDYDDLLVYLKFLLQTKEEVRKKLSKRYSYIMVDEYQDTNKIQADLVYWLAKEHNNIMVVGDDAQSIYSFRGANFRNILNFREYFPSYYEIKLEISYRSTQPILNFANAVLLPAKDVTPRNLVTNRKDKGSKPYFWRLSDQTVEAEKITAEILKLRNHSTKLSDIAVLVRNAFHAREIERFCTKRRIPYVFYGGRRWSELAHVQDIVAYLRISMNKNDIVAWQRILVLIPFLGAKGALSIIKELEKSDFNIKLLKSSKFSSKKYFEDISKLSDVLISISNDDVRLNTRIDKLIEYYTPFLEKKKNANTRQGDLIYFRQKSLEFNTLEEFLSEMALTPPNDKVEVKESMATNAKERPMVISTIHSAKGLEWNTVFIARVLDGDIPSSRSVDSIEQLEEERRLFYVAITRAKDNLYLTAPQRMRWGRSYGNLDSMEYNEESRFLKDLSDIETLVERRLFSF
jgi:DNA helicase-2/ATP-dependent DNA helicase PcrA